MCLTPRLDGTRLAERIVHFADGGSQFNEGLIRISWAIGIFDDGCGPVPKNIKALFGFRRCVQREKTAQQPVNIPV